MRWSASITQMPWPMFSSVACSSLRLKRSASDASSSIAMASPRDSDRPWSEAAITTRADAAPMAPAISVSVKRTASRSAGPASPLRPAELRRPPLAA